MNPAALQGLRVVELGTLFAARLFAEFGADVVKVEPPGGDPLRNWRVVRDGTSLWWHSQGRNKKSIGYGEDEQQALRKEGAVA